MYNNKSDWERMVNGKLYNPANKDIENSTNAGLFCATNSTEYPFGRRKESEKRSKN